MFAVVEKVNNPLKRTPSEEAARSLRNGIAWQQSVSWFYSLKNLKQSWLPVSWKKTKTTTTTKTKTKNKKTTTKNTEMIKNNAIQFGNTRQDDASCPVLSSWKVHKRLNRTLFNQTKPDRTQIFEGILFFKAILFYIFICIHYHHTSSSLGTKLSLVSGQKQSVLPLTNWRQGKHVNTSCVHLDTKQLRHDSNEVTQAVWTGTEKVKHTSRCLQRT